MRPTSDPRPPTRLAFHASRIVTSVGVLLAMGALSLPFVTGAAERNAVEADALPAVALLLPIFLVTLIPDHTRPLPNVFGWLSLVLGIAALPYAIVKFVQTNTLADTLGASVGVGPRLLVFGTVVTLLGIVIGLTRNVMRLPSGGTYPAIREPKPQEEGA